MLQYCFLYLPPGSIFVFRARPFIEVFYFWKEGQGSRDLSFSEIETRLIDISCFMYQYKSIITF